MKSKVKKGLKVKVHLAKIGSTYGITTGRAIRVNKQNKQGDLIELIPCDPIDLKDIDLFREHTEVHFNVRYANGLRFYTDWYESAVLNGIKEVYLTLEKISYFKLKKKYFDDAYAGGLKAELF